MRVPLPLSEAFGAHFEELIGQFATEKGLLSDVETLRSTRFLSRSVIPHIRKLSTLFNRLEPKDPNAPFEDRKKGRKSRIREEGQGGGLPQGGRRPPRRQCKAQVIARKHVSNNRGSLFEGASCICEGIAPPPPR